jgi:ketosteroid isomerase-like protein
MKPTGIILLLIGLLPWSVAMKSPNQEEKVRQDRAVIRQIIYDSIGWALTKDRDRLESIMCHDADLFIFHPGWAETIVGWEAFVKLFDVWMDPRFRATRFRVTDTRINISSSGDVAWFSAILDDHGEWDGKSLSWKDTRWTGVLERSGGEWRIVQMHFSFAADKVLEQAEGGQGEDRGPEGGENRVDFEGQSR